MNKKIIIKAVSAVGFILGIYASCIEPFMLRVTPLTIQTEKWTNKNPLRIAVISDFHMIKPWMTASHVADIVEKANTLNPDVVLLLGDYVGTHPFGLQIAPDEGLAPLKNLKSKCGVFAILGNHDLHPVGKWPDALARADIPLLNNRAEDVPCNNEKFWIAGLKDLWWEEPSIKDTLAMVTDNNPVIMMMHNPDLFVNVPHSVVLSLAGHTHGGQVRLPFIGAVPFVVLSQYGARYAYGHIVEDGKDLFVTAGTGMTGLPIRFMNPPEIAIITVTGKSE